MSIERILVPLDLSPLGEVKLPVAVSQARAFGAELILLHVLRENSASAEGNVSPKEARARAYLDAIAARIRAEDVHARPLVRFGPVAQTVVEATREEHVDLIIIGSDVRTGISRLFLGSVAAEIVRSAPCPVLLVRPEVTAINAAPAVRSFADDAARAGPLAPRSLGLRTVEIARIVGSVGRSAELGPDFRPGQRRKEDEDRYERIVRAMEQGDSLPPVELYKLGYGYYILDGNHRVAAAKQLGQIEIDAMVTEFLPLADTEAQRVFSERRAFEQLTGLTRIGVAQPGNYARLEGFIREYAERHGTDDIREAALRWYADIGRPLSLRIRTMRLGQHFPGERTADILIRVIDFQRTESERQKQELAWDEALPQFAAAQLHAE